MVLNLSFVLLYHRMYHYFLFTRVLDEVRTRLATERPEAPRVVGLKVAVHDEMDDPDLPFLHEDDCVSNTKAHMEPDDYFEGVLKAAMSAVAGQEAAHRQYAKSASRLCDMLFRPNRKETHRSCWPP